MGCAICDGPVEHGKKLCDACRARLAAPKAANPPPAADMRYLPDGTPVPSVAPAPTAETLLLPDGTPVPVTSSLEAPFQPPPPVPDVVPVITFPSEEAAMGAPAVPHVSFPGQPTPHNASLPAADAAPAWPWLTPARMKLIIGACLALVLITVLMAWHPWQRRYVPPPRVEAIDVEGAGL